MDPIQTLAEYFSRFPGIGPRQAKRFVYYLLSRDKSYIEDFSKSIAAIKETVLQCSSCFRYFQKDSQMQMGESNSKLCEICRDEHTDKTLLLIVEKDADFENIRKAGSYGGLFFILGGVIPILEKTPTQKVRVRELFDRVQDTAKTRELKEVILAMNATPEGENTALYVSKILEPLIQKFNFKLSTLGRGLSTGTELEYSDADTFKSALENRK
ncbi:toprim domain-containing protein [bacterium]|nr:toprim domain-containing protein [bacterium]